MSDTSLHTDEKGVEHNNTFFQAATSVAFLNENPYDDPPGTKGLCYYY
jgi:hypothetical protein